MKIPFHKYPALCFALLLLVASLAPGAAEAQSLAGSRQSLTISAACTNTNTACAAGTDLIIPTTGFESVYFTFYGTYTGLAINFETSDDGGTTWYATISARVDSGQMGPNFSPGATQFEAYEVPSFGQPFTRFRVSAITTGSVTVNGTPISLPSMRSILPLAYSSSGAALTVIPQNSAGVQDPCGNSAPLKLSVPINISSATAVQLVALVAGKSIYVCGFVADIAGSATTAGTLQFEYGTQTTNPCDTGTTTLTGAMGGNLTAGVPTVIEYQGPNTVFTAASAKQLCAVATGTTIAIQGVLTYVQQ
jgi:hypothetical protein